MESDSGVNVVDSNSQVSAKYWRIRLVEGSPGKDDLVLHLLNCFLCLSICLSVHCLSTLYINQSICQISTKLACLYGMDSPEGLLGFGDLDPIFKVTKCLNVYLSILYIGYTI